MSFSHPPSRRPRRARLPVPLARFWPARSGVAAVEFALVLPVMLILWLGMVEVTVALNLDRKVTILSRTVADLVGRETATDTRRLGEIFDAATAVMAPFEHRNVEIVVTSVFVSRNAENAIVGRVCWSRTRPVAGSPRLAHRAGDPMPVPTGFDHPGSSFIVAEVFAPYRPSVGSGVVGDITLSERTAWPVRNTTQVTFETLACPT